MAKKATAVSPRETTACLSRAFCGGCGRDVRGAIFRRGLGSGTVSSSGFGTLRRGAFLNAFSMRYRMIRTSSTCLWTARLSRRTGRRPAQKRIVNAVKHNGPQAQNKARCNGHTARSCLVYVLPAGRGRKKALYGRLIGTAAFNLWIRILTMTPNRTKEAHAPLRS